MKYNNKKTVIDGIKFDSKKEAYRYEELKLLKKNKNIKNLVLQPAFEIQPKYRINGRSVRAIKYIADFQYYDNDKKQTVIEDVKGMKTPVYKIKKKMFEYIYKQEITEI